MKKLLTILALLLVPCAALAFDLNLPASVSFNEDSSTTLDLIGGGYLNLSTGESITSYSFTGNTNTIVTVASNVLTFSAKANWNGAETVTVNATNGTNFITDTIVVNVLPVNDAPTLNVSTSLKAYVGTQFNLQLTATDPDGGMFTYSSGAGEWTTFAMTPAGTISFTPTDSDFGLHKVILTVKDNTGLTNSKTVSFLVTDATDDGALTFSDYSSDDVTGDDTELNPGDSIDVSYELENKLTTELTGVKVESWIEDSSGTKVTDKIEIDSVDISDRDTSTGDFTIVVPVDSKEESFYLFVRAAGDDENDTERSALHVEELKVTKQEHDIAFDSVTVNPDPAICGQTVDIITDIWNVGTKDETAIKLRVQNTALGIDVYSDLFALKRSGNDAEGVITIPVLLGDVAPGNYTLTVSASYNSGKDTESTTTTLSVLCSGYVQPEEDKGGAGALTFAETSVEGKQGQQLKIAATLKNTGTTAAVYTFEMTGIQDWASGFVEPDTVTLAGGANTEVFVYITPKMSATGDKTATLTVKSGGAVLESETLTVVLPEKPGISIISLGNIPEVDTTTAALVIIGVLIVVALIIAGKKRAAMAEVRTYGKKRGRKSADDEE